jgi:hypothetical protein
MSSILVKLPPAKAGGLKIAAKAAVKNFVNYPRLKAGGLKFISAAKAAF